MIEGIHLFDQALAFIRQDSLEVIVNDSRFQNPDGGTKVAAYEVLAKEFEFYWRQIIGQEVAKLFQIDPMEPDVLLLTIWKSDDRPQ